MANQGIPEITDVNSNLDDMEQSFENLVGDAGANLTNKKCGSDLESVMQSAKDGASTYPCVLVFSEGSVDAKEISKNIIRANEETLLLYSGDDSSNFQGYMCNIKTKYYENSIVLSPVENIAHLPSGYQKNVEALIVYFDSLNKNSFAKIRAYADYLKNQNIENGILLFNKTTNDSDEGLTYKDMKVASNFLLDVIELNRLPDQDDDDNVCGYKEVIQTLCSYIWSNIDIKQDAKVSATSSHGSESSDNNVEAQMEGFENLFMKIQAFKSVSSSLNREDVLNHAEKLAIQFVNLMSNDDDEL